MKIVLPIDIDTTWERNTISKVELLVLGRYGQPGTFPEGTKEVDQ
jgi:hypothetical protein